MKFLVPILLLLVGTGVVAVAAAQAGGGDIVYTAAGESPSVRWAG